MKVELIDITSLTPDPANVRRHDRKNLDAIKGALARFKQQTPIVVDQDGIVRKGNGTLEAARELGWAEIAIVRTTLTGAEATAYSIADNRAGELSEWDDAALGAMLGSLDADLLAAAGFDEGELEKLLDGGGDIDPQATGGDPGEGGYKEQHGVIVICETTTEQATVYERLKADGYNCRVVST